MNLSNAHLAEVAREKIVAYLLNPAHPDNGGKAAFFTGLGFSLDAWQVLAAALCQLAVDSATTRMDESPHGRKFVLEGLLQTPAGRTPRVRTIWIIDRGMANPRLVTAYPIE